MAPKFLTRAATLDDIDSLLENLRAGFATYVELAPVGRARLVEHRIALSSRPTPPGPRRR
jgi:hypothetical protein